MSKHKAEAVNGRVAAAAKRRGRENVLKKKETPEPHHRKGGGGARASTKDRGGLCVCVCLELLCDTSTGYVRAQIALALHRRRAHARSHLQKWVGRVHGGEGQR